MADSHVWHGAGALRKAIKRKMDSSGEKEQLAPLQKDVFLMRQNLYFTQYGAELKAKAVFKVAINLQSFRKAAIS